MGCRALHLLRMLSHVELVVEVHDVANELAVVVLHAMVRLADKVVPVVCPSCKLVVLHGVVEVVVVEFPVVFVAVFVVVVVVAIAKMVVVVVVVLEE